LKNTAIFGGVFCRPREIVFCNKKNAAVAGGVFRMLLKGRKGEKEIEHS